MVPNSLGPGELLRPLRHARSRSSYYLPRLAQGPRDPVLRADQSVRGLGRGGDSRLRVSCAGASTRASACSACRSPGTSATSRSARSRRCSASRSASTTRTSSSASKEDLGITCALIPTSHPGVHIGRRHMPLNAVFQNGPNSGRDVFIPMDWVIGGQPMVGQGLADADGVPRRRPRHLAAVVEHRHGEARRARGRRLRARAHAVQDADRQVRGRRGSRSRAWAATST